MLDTAAVRAALTRLQKITRPPDSGPHYLGAQLALLREYLRRAGLVAQALGHDGRWPWLDAAAQLTRIGNPPPVPDVAAEALPGYTILEDNPLYPGPGLDPLEDEVLAMMKDVSGYYERRICLYYVRWEALKNRPAVRALALPDLYEPLILFYERGGWFRTEHGNIDLTYMMLAPGSPADQVERLPLPSLAPTALDELDRAYTRRSLDELLTKLLAQAATALRAYEATLQPPAPEAALAALQARAHTELGAAVPAGYLTFLRLADGLNWDGLFVYGSGPYPLVTEPTVFVRDFVATNLAWRQAEPAAAPRLYLAEDEELRYGYDPAAGPEPYQVYERADGTVTKRFQSAEELLGHALQKHVFADAKARRGQR